MSGSPCPAAVAEAETAQATAQALIAFGGNLGEPRHIIAEGIARFCDGTHVRLLARSSDYLTPPWGVEDQPPFINAGIRVETDLAPQALLAHGLAVEKLFGRDRNRETRFGPRRLDIDLIDYEGVRLCEDELTLPHPRALDRAFVLVPLAEIAPDWQIGGHPLREAAGRLDRSGIIRLPPLHPEV